MFVPEPHALRGEGKQITAFWHPWQRKFDRCLALCKDHARLRHPAREPGKRDACRTQNPTTRILASGHRNPPCRVLSEFPAREHNKIEGPVSSDTRILDFGIV